jgi:hypothetical protein
MKKECLTLSALKNAFTQTDPFSSTKFSQMAVTRGAIPKESSNPANVKPLF